MEMNNQRILALGLFMLALLVALPQMTAQIAAASSTFGAIAYSFRAKQYGVGAGETKAEAKKNALKFCEKGDCEVLVEYKQECGALVVSKDGYYGAGVGKNKAEAQKNAMDFCRKSAKGCELVVTDCTFED
jgi:hypothetical protein